MKKTMFFLLMAIFAFSTCKKDNDDTTTGDENNEQIAFYTDSDNCGAIEIELDGSSIGSLTTVYSAVSDPTCGSPNTLTVDVSIGIHNYHAEGNCNNIWEGSIIINQGDCKVKLLSR
jgi:hypothetical protein